MKTTNTFGLHFVARPKRSSPGELWIFVRITVGKKVAEISLKRKVESQYWDQANESIKGNKKLQQELKPFLDDVRYKFTECFRKLQVERRPISATALKNAFLGKEESSYTLCSLMKYHNDNMKTVLAPGTLKNYFTTERYIKLFLEKKHRCKDLDLLELNFQFITEFEIFLRKTTSFDASNPLTNNGIMKHMERLRKMVTLAAKMEWIPKDPFQQYSLKFQKVDKAFLTLQELTTVETKELKIQKLHLARDLFIFSCYTGLAYVDLMALRPAHICLGFDGHLWLKTARRKTEVPVNIPLLSKAHAILQKYQDDPRAKNKERLFPRLSNQKINAYLKQIGVACEIAKPFSFHTARHTFATTVTLANGVPIETVSKMLGHTKLSTTQIYARVLERKVGEDMMQLRAKLENVC
ncbi:MAG TPA: site-specific integrase [Flavisolibacter sp.]|nr:site-specific integrase [Flavisolibacter sp.]